MGGQFTNFGIFDWLELGHQQFPVKDANPFEHDTIDVIPRMAGDVQLGGENLPPPFLTLI